jgi:hypothetical protein
MPRLWRLAVAVAVTAGLVAPAALPFTAKADEVTVSQDQARTGWDPHEPGLSPQAVSSPSFGKLFEAPVDGQVYAQPLVVGKSLIVATEKDNVYSLNAQTGAENWKLSLGPSWPASASGCGDLTPDIGVTSTPVYSASTGEVYLTAVENNGKSLYQPNVYFVAVNAATGHLDWQSLVQGAPVNARTRSFDPLTERQRASLLLLNGMVYVGFASYCDFTPYTGLVAAVNTSSHAVSLWTDEAAPSGKQAGIWMSDGGLMSDGSGRIFATSGNGVAPPAGPGNRPPADLSESVFRLAPSNGSVTAKDFFSPANAPQLDAHDTDLGSGGPVALPFGTAKHPHLLIQAGKDGRLFVLDRDNLGGRSATSDHPVSVNGPLPGQYGHPAAFAGTSGNDFVYYLGANDFLRALRFSTATGKLTDTGNSPGTFPHGSGAPVVTSNGTNPASAVVWLVDRAGAKSAFDAFSAIPAGGKLKPLWSAPIGTATKYTVPATANGRVYVGTADGEVFGFGVVATAAVSGAAANFGAADVGTAPAQPVTVTARVPVTVTGASTTSPAATDPFTAGTPSVGGQSVTFPVALKAGGKLTVPVTFAPASPGGVTGSLVLTTSAPSSPTVTVPLSGTGTKAGFYPTQPTLRFATVPTDSSLTIQAVIVNGGATSETWSTIPPPANPVFTIISQPASGTLVQPGQAVTVSVTYQPTGTTGDSGTFTEPSSVAGGTPATVSMTGVGIVGRGTLATQPGSVAFGDVALGQQASGSVNVSNTGNLPMTVTGFTEPGPPFGTPETAPLSAGFILPPGDDIDIPVTFTPQSESATSGAYTLTASDGFHPAQALTIGVSGTGVAPSSGAAIPSPGGGWTLNGSAQMTGTTLRLTPAANGQAGSAVYYQPLPSAGLHARFTAQLGGGNGADGLTFGLVDAGHAAPSALGGGGADLGFGGIPGVAVALDTYPSNMIGIATGTTKSGLSFAATNKNVPDLRSGTHVIDVTVTGSGPSTVAVKVDGRQYLAAKVTLPSRVLAAFTAATGALNDVHAVSAVAVSSGAVVLPPPGGGWSYNGAATMAGSDTALTRAVANQTGSVVYPAAQSANGLQAAFGLRIGGGSGGEGMTFALLSQAAKPTVTGGGGSALGFGGLPGVAVVFDTHQVPGYPSSNFVGIATGTAKPGVLRLAAAADQPTSLRSGTHNAVVTVNGGVVTVYLDGVQVLQKAVPVPAKALLAFTGSGSALTDLHVVRDAAISAH